MLPLLDAWRLFGIALAEATCPTLALVAWHISIWQMDFFQTFPLIVMIYDFQIIYSIMNHDSIRVIEIDRILKCIYLLTQ